MNSRSRRSCLGFSYSTEVLATSGVKALSPEKPSWISDLSDERVKMSLSGKILDMDYVRLMAQNKDLTLEEIMMLDKVQKKHLLSSFEEKYLKRKKLIKNRKPSFYTGLKVAQKTGQKADYTKTKGFDKQYYLDLIIKAIKEHKELSRKEIDELLWN